VIVVLGIFSLFLLKLYSTLPRTVPMSHFFFSRYGLISSDTKGGREGSSNSAGAAFALAQVDQDLFSLMFQGGRPYMEDLHVILHSLDNVKDVSLFAAIFDGHSGKRAALHAREKLPVCLSSHLSQGIDPVTALHKAFQETDSEFIEQARRESMNDGCTAIALLIHKNNLYVANAGDSRALLVRKDNVVPMSRDHKPNLDSEKSRIVAAGGMVVNLGCPRVQGVLATSRGFGDLELKKFLTCEPEVYNRSICEGDDFLLMASGMDPVNAFVTLQMECGTQSRLTTFGPFSTLPNLVDWFLWQIL
jgi:serine/threonine protein phosphatase PrpC